MAGHSKWANIKHRKARQDSKRSREWSRCARAIIVAAKNGGGDPDANLSLRYAIDEAKAANMTKDTIINAIKKGSGELGTGENYEPVTYEGYGPNGVAVFIEVLTDNKNRTVGEIRTIFNKRGGNMATSGSVAYLFTPKGQFTLPKDVVTEERLMEIALEAGAEDVADEDAFWLVTTEQADFHAVKQALDAASLVPETAELTMVPSMTVPCSAGEAQTLLGLIEDLEDQDDVQKVHANFDIPDEIMAQLGG